MRGERHVGGLWCHEVLDLLSDYVDGELDDASRGTVEAHLAECRQCERFGGDYAETVARIRRSLAEPRDLADDVAARLRERLALGYEEP